MGLLLQCTVGAMLILFSTCIACGTWHEVPYSVDKPSWFRKSDGNVVPKQ